MMGTSVIFPDSTSEAYAAHVITCLLKQREFDAEHLLVPGCTGYRKLVVSDNQRAPLSRRQVPKDDDRYLSSRVSGLPKPAHGQR